MLHGYIPEAQSIHCAGICTKTYTDMLSAEKKLHIQLTMSFFTQQILPDGSFVAVQDIILLNHAGNNSSAITFPIKLKTVMFSLLTTY